ncbi:hypothetical protein PF011_g2852 [Phytophthora fragariae]|nr:hypothetical protein PF003_g35070 [Phytophthora fragariae]KAE9025852.1 hypothetical protein PF011_g2852 [Phytophthora fragariae]
MEVCTELAPTEAEQHERQKLAAVYVPRLAAVAEKNPRSATYQPISREPIIVEVDLNYIPPRQLESPELKAFWGTFTWDDNPWIPDSNVPVLLRTKYDRIAVTSPTSLEIIRTAWSTYSVRVPTAPGFQEGHTIAKLERWLIAILLHSPRIQEMALYDMSAIINYVLTTTGHSTLCYVGNSEGTMQAFAGFSVDQELARKVSYFGALAPVAYLGHITSSIF